jgi:hypothetical protein
MSKRYEVFRKGFDGDVRDIRTYDKAVDRLIEKIPSGEAYQWKRRGADVWRLEPSKPQLRETLLNKNLQVGEAIWTRRLGGRVFVLRCIEVITLPDCPVTDPTPAIKELWDDTFTAYLDLGNGYEFVYMGGFVCRRIDGSSTWSNHAFHNAFDFRVRRASNPEMSIDTEATTKVVNKVKAKAAEALWQTSGHYFHAHLTGDPKKFGTPVCA